MSRKSSSRQFQPAQRVGGLADHLLGPLLGGRKDDVAQLVILASARAVIGHLVDVHALAVGVVALGLRGLGFARSHAADEIARRIGGNQNGRAEERC